MKKFTQTVLALASVLVADAQLIPADVTGLVINPSFEECETGASNGEIKGWTLNGREKLDWVVEDTRDHNSDNGKCIVLNKTSSSNNLIRPGNIVSQKIRTDLGAGTYVLTVSANVSRNNWRGDIDGWDKPVADASKNIRWSFGFVFIEDGTVPDDQHHRTFHPGATIIRECGQGRKGNGEENAKAPVYYAYEQAVDEDGSPKYENGEPVMVKVERRGGFKVFHAFLTTSADELEIGFGIPDNPSSPVDVNDITYVSVNGDGAAPYDYTGNKNWEAGCLTSISKGGMRFDNVRLEFYETDDIDAVKALYEGKDNAGIDNVIVKYPEDDIYYNMQGIRVDNPTRPGLYIRNGQKVMVR